MNGSESFIELNNKNSKDGIFVFHGWLGPGVRLFRSITFPAKAALMLATLIIPICGLLFLLYRNNAENVDIAKSELQGMVYVNAVNQLAQDLSDMRADAVLKGSSLNDKQSRVNASWGKVKSVQSEFGPVFGEETKTSFDKLEKVLQGLLQKTTLDSPDATFLAYTKTVDACLDLLGSVSDDSQLALDPQLDTYHLMNLSVVVGPQYLEYLARLRILGQLSITLDSKKSLDAGRRNAFERYQTLIDYVDPLFEGSYHKSIEAYPDVASGLDMKGADSTREAFMSALEKQILGDTVQGELQAFQAVSAPPLEKQLMLNQHIGKRLEARLQERIDGLWRMMLLELLFPAFFLLISLYLMLSFYRVMQGGLKLVSEHLSELANGDLRNRPVNPLGKDEPAMLIHGLHQVYDSMRELIRRVRHSARELAITSSEVSRASLDLSQRTEAAASNLGQQAGAIALIGEQTKQSANRTEMAAAMAQENAKVAEAGGQIVSTVNKIMQDIQASSHRIADIIGTIDGIAFQTNILALNAAVEAARAGESGRGFAVVATEVRALAGRSANAAREIKQLISTSVNEVSEGSIVVEGAKGNMAEMMANASQIDLFLREIAQATSNQATEVDRIVDSIIQLDSNTQQNAALVEETSASAESLKNQAENLTEEISRFRVA